MRDEIKQYKDEIEKYKNEIEIYKENELKRGKNINNYKKIIFVNMNDKKEYPINISINEKGITLEEIIKLLYSTYPQLKNNIKIKKYKNDNLDEQTETTNDNVTRIGFYPNENRF